MIWTKEDRKEFSDTGLSVFLIFLGGAILVGARDLDPSYLILFVVISYVLFAGGIYIRHRSIKKLKERQKKDIINSKVENLLLHLSTLKLSLVANERQIEKNSTLKDHYYSIISEIDLVEKNIESEINKLFNF